MKNHGIKMKGRTYPPKKKKEEKWKMLLYRILECFFCWPHCFGNRRGEVEHGNSKLQQTIFGQPKKKKKRVSNYDGFRSPIEKKMLFWNFKITLLSKFLILCRRKKLTCIRILLYVMIYWNDMK